MTLGAARSAVPSEMNEWLETDGLGGFASGTTLGINTRRMGARFRPGPSPSCSASSATCSESIPSGVWSSADPSGSSGQLDLAPADRHHRTPHLDRFEALRTTRGPRV
jgi:hypothetical protein